MHFLSEYWFVCQFQLEKIPGNGWHLQPEGGYAYTCDSMENSGPSNHETDTWSSRHIPIYTGGIAAGLLVTERNEPDSQIDRLFCDVDDGNSHQAEDDRDAQVA